MRQVIRHEANYDEVFRFAERQFGINWNECCNIFHGTEILRESFSDVYLEDLKCSVDEHMERSKYDIRHLDIAKAKEILIAFLETNNVTECRIFTDC